MSSDPNDPINEGVTPDRRPSDLPPSTSEGDRSPRRTARREDPAAPPDVGWKLLLPGAAMIATAVLNIFLALGSFGLGNLFQKMPQEEIEKVMEQQSEQDRAMLEQQGIGPEELRDIYIYTFNITGIAALVGGIIITIGGICMCARKARGLAILAAVITAIPCINSPCILLGMPVGLWALLVLFQPDVKAAFR